MINKEFLGLALASMALCGLTACSSSDDSGEPVGPTPSSVLGTLGLIQNSTSGRVINLGGGSSAAKAFTRAVSTNAPTGSLTMPSVPQTSDAADLTSRVSKLTEKTVQRSSSAAITLEKLDLNGQELIVKGNLTLNAITGNGTIYVDGPSAKLTLGANVKELNGVRLVLANATQKDESKAALVLKSNTLTVDANAGIYANSLVNLPNVALTNNGNIYVGANKAEDAFLHVAAATLGTGSKTEIAYNLNVDGDLTVNGQLIVGKTVWAQHINVGGTLVSNSKINAYQGMTVSGQGAKVYADYLKVGGMNGKGHLKADGENVKVDVATLTQADGSQIILGNQGFIEVYNYENNDNGNAFIDCDAANGLAILNVQNLRWKGTADPEFLHTSGSGAEFGVQFAHAYQDGTEVDWDDLSFNGGTTRKIEEEKEFADMSIPANEATAFLGYNANGEGSGKDATAYKMLRAVSEVTFDDNNSLSATCVQAGANNNVYVSYHSRTDKQAGRLEVMSTTADATTLKQSISAAGADNAIDWNHITVAGSHLLGVGNSLKGGLLTSIDITSDGTLNTTSTTVAGETLLPLKYVILRGGDGNAVIADGNQYDVASLYGVETFNQNLEGLGTHRYPGNGKHIAINGNTIATAYFTGNVDNSSDETAKTPATLRVATYAAGEQDFDSPTATTDITGVWPTNGKNTVAVADGKTYVAAGARGLAIIDGTNVTYYQPENATVQSTDDNEGKLAVGTVRGFCNGVCVKGNYIYLAYGSLGVIVLDKNDPTPGKEVARYNAGKSANYVTVTDNGYIYVANGLNRLKVLKLVDYSRNNK